MNSNALAITLRDECTDGEQPILCPSDRSRLQMLGEVPLQNQSGCRPRPKPISAYRNDELADLQTPAPSPEASARAA